MVSWVGFYSFANIMITVDDHRGHRSPTTFWTSGTSSWRKVPWRSVPVEPAVVSLALTAIAIAAHP